MDVERKRTFTMMIREGVAMHAFNGELFVQATWDTSRRGFPDTVPDGSPKRISNPNNTGDSRNCRAGVQINDSGRRWDITSARTAILAGCRRNGHGYPVSYPAGAPRSFTFLNPWRTGRPRCKCVLQRDGADEDARHAAEHAAAERHCEGDVCRHH
ncbi:phage portal protein [Escherichia coli]|uniref:phage portal protein n=1 Tax=Escherichia coli TaxID=562 RepID=UPI003D815B8B